MGGLIKEGKSGSMGVTHLIHASILLGAAKVSEASLGGARV